MKKEEIYWCLFWPDGNPIIRTIAYTRKTAVENRKKLLAIPSVFWSRLYKLGYRCKRVRIVEAR